MVEHASEVEVALEAMADKLEELDVAQFDMVEAVVDRPVVVEVELLQLQMEVVLLAMDDELFLIHEQLYVQHLDASVTSCTSGCMECQQRFYLLQ